MPTALARYILGFLRNQNLQSNNITKEQIKEKAISIYVGDKFVASDRWASAFMKRYHRKENNSHVFHDDLDKGTGKSLVEAPFLEGID